MHDGATRTPVLAAPPGPDRHGARGRVVLVAAAALTLLGIALVALSGFGYGPQVTAHQEESPVGAVVAPTGKLSAKAATKPLTPTRITIPAIGVRASVTPVGLDAKGALQVPQPGKTGWWKQGAKAGAGGVAVLDGHVDSLHGPDVFARLAELRPGQKVQLSGADGAAFVYRVDRVRHFAKDAFPTRLVYAPTKGAELRLITCGGAYDRNDGGYQDNIVVFGTLIQRR